MTTIWIAPQKGSTSMLIFPQPCSLYYHQCLLFSPGLHCVSLLVLFVCSSVQPIHVFPIHVFSNPPIKFKYSFVVSISPTTLRRKQCSQLAPYKNYRCRRQKSSTISYDQLVVKVRKFSIPIMQFCSYIKLFCYSIAVSWYRSHAAPEPVHIGIRSRTRKYVLKCSICNASASSSSSSLTNCFPQHLVQELRYQPKFQQSYRRRRPVLSCWT